MNVQLDEPVSARLDAYARRVGRSPDDVASEAVDRLLATAPQDPTREGDWRAALEGIRGMWRDRDDLDELFAKIRLEADRVEPPEGPP